MSQKLFVLTLAVLPLATAAVFADGKTRAAEEAAEFILRKFGKEATKDGASALARRIEQAAVAHGDEVFKAVRLAGPRGLHLIEEAGVHSKQVARLLATHGEHGAVFVASRPRAMQLVLQHGDEAALAVVKSRGVAVPAIESLGKPAVRAFSAIGSPQNARRLAMMAADGGELASIGRTPELLAVVETYGDKAMTFIWEHKGALTVAATLVAFLAEPEPFIDGAKELTATVVKPLADVPAIAAKEGSAEVARKTNWTLVFLALIAALALLAAARWRLFARSRRAPEKEP
ncbi:MAG TPA: hypothetical protein VMF69_22615 [Gemmataceae bacterium]|nr:hypothetical protein [Gemmataceae bacterium]